MKIHIPTPVSTPNEMIAAIEAHRAAEAERLSLELKQKKKQVVQQLDRYDALGGEDLLAKAKATAQRIRDIQARLAELKPKATYPQ